MNSNALFNISLLIRKLFFINLLFLNPILLSVEHQNIFKICSSDGDKCPKNICYLFQEEQIKFIYIYVDIYTT